jgi:hypothetical protein
MSRHVCMISWKLSHFFGAALEEGVYFQYAWHHGLCAIHTRTDVEATLNGIEAAARRGARRAS